MTITDTLPTLWEGDSPRVRSTDPITSHLAADTSDLHGSQLAVLRVLNLQPYAQFAIVDILELSPSSFANGIRYTDSRVRSACSELVERGYAEDSGAKVRTPSGRSAVVWSITPAGRDYLGTVNP